MLCGLAVYCLVILVVIWLLLRDYGCWVVACVGVGFGLCFAVLFGWVVVDALPGVVLFVMIGLLVMFNVGGFPC